MINFNKKLTALALLVAASASGSMLAILTVSAQPYQSGGIKSVTLYSNDSSSGQSFTSNYAVADLSKVGFNDRTSFIQIDDGQKWRFYKDKNFKGEFIEVGPDIARGNLGKLDKQISSFRPVK